MNYPNGLKKQHTNHLITYGNRGMNLESDLNLTNEYYRNIDKAYIYKKPTPIKIVKVDYKSRKLATINEAYFMEPSTTDYNGIYRGKYIDFEAKETKSKTSFSLENIHKHQIRHIKKPSTLSLQRPPTMTMSRITLTPQALKASSISLRNSTAMPL